MDVSERSTATPRDLAVDSDVSQVRVRCTHLPRAVWSPIPLYDIVVEDCAVEREPGGLDLAFGVSELAGGSTPYVKLGVSEVSVR